MKARGLGQSSLLHLEITQGVAGAKEKRDIWNTSENRWPPRRRVKFPWKHEFQNTLSERKIAEKHNHNLRKYETKWLSVSTHKC